MYRAPDAEEQSAPDDIAGYVRERKKSSKNFGKYMEVQKYLPADKAKRKKVFQVRPLKPPTRFILHLPWVESFSLPLTPLHTHFLDGVQSFVVFFMASLRGHALT